jgi:hypothetical protein
MRARFKRITLASLVGVAVYLGIFSAYRYLTYAASPYPYSLREALWVTDREMNQFYPPHSAESEAILATLEKEGVETNKKAYLEHVLYRMGLTTKDEPTEKLLILGFQPPQGQSY